MIVCNTTGRAEVRRGIQRDLRSFNGACAVRVIEGGNKHVGEHTHDWPVLSLYVMGDVVKIQDGHEIRVNRPCVVLQDAGNPHSSFVRRAGLEQVDIEFDPAWLGFNSKYARNTGASIWTGGRVAADAKELRRLWLDPASTEADLSRATARFLTIAPAATRPREPQWVATVLHELHERRVSCTRHLAAELNLHPGWLAQGFRAAVGEGIAETAQRVRVQEASQLLRSSALPAAQIAAEAGFCDQSHMIRSFKRILGRSPTAVRAEALELSSR